MKKRPNRIANEEKLRKIRLDVKRDDKGAQGVNTANPS